MIVTRTPLRCSFLGGGSDFPDYYNVYGGACLSTTINKYVYVIAKHRFDDRIVLHYTKTEDVERVADVQHDIIREALAHAGVFRGVEITTMADIPSSGTGLGSSSALTVGVLNALYSLQGITRGKADLAPDACEIEVDRLQMTPGKQDQYAAAYGGFRLITFQKGQIDLSPIPGRSRRALNHRLMLFFTGETREAKDLLVEQNKAIPDKLEILEKMVKLCQKGAKQLKDGRIDGFGNMLDIGWNLKKQLHPQVSNEAIDAMYSKALSGGATGGKVCGAGGGGFLLLWVEPEAQDGVKEALSEYRELPFKCETMGSAVILKE